MYNCVQPVCLVHMKALEGDESSRMGGTGGYVSHVDAGNQTHVSGGAAITFLSYLSSPVRFTFLKMSVFL